MAPRLTDRPTVLPLHPAPGKDELFSSWITRVALDNGHQPPALLLALGHGQVFKNDPDLSTPDTTLLKLAQVTSQPAQLILDTSLRPMLARLHGEVRPTAHLAFLVTPGKSRGVEQARGHPVCLACLAEDGQLRRAWRLTTTVICERHRVALNDQCPHCGQPISLLRPQLARATRRRPPPIRHPARCPDCLRWMSPGPPPAPEVLASAHLVQQWMVQAVTADTVKLPDLTLPAPDFAELLAVTGNRQREAARLLLPAPFQSEAFRGKPMLEYASPAFRLPMVAGVGYLLQRGVLGLFEALSKAHITSKDFLTGRPEGQLPSWLRDLSFDALSCRPHARRLVPRAHFSFP